MENYIYKISFFSPQGWSAEGGCEADFICLSLAQAQAYLRKCADDLKSVHRNGGTIVVEPMFFSKELGCYVEDERWFTEGIDSGGEHHYEISKDFMKITGMVKFSAEEFDRFLH